MDILLDFTGVPTTRRSLRFFKEAERILKTEREGSIRSERETARDPFLRVSFAEKEFEEHARQIRGGHAQLMPVKGRSGPLSSFAATQGNSLASHVKF